jgi:dUTP pyrophosphatase
MRKFEKISVEQYEKDLKELCSYEDISIPTRSTKHSAGYDFKSPIEFTLNPGESKKVPTGIKASMNEDEFLAILVRSSMGFKYNIRLCNQVGIVDSDYYNNPDNEGHIFVALKNEGDKVFKVEKGDRYAQGIFQKYLLTDDDDADGERTGGFGSTNK